jgi:hypothetical protein
MTDPAEIAMALLVAVTIKAYALMLLWKLS